MGPLRKVLCAVEMDLPGPLGATAQVVLRAADREARWHGAELAILHALPTNPGAPMSPEAAEQAILQREEISSAVIEAVLAAVEQVTGRDPDDVTVQVEDGPAEKAIVGVADRIGADLVVVGSTGAKGLRRLLLGSVATGVVRHGHTSVLVARPAPESGLVLLAVDFSPASHAAAEVAAEEARRRGARLCLVHSVEILTPELALAEPGVVPPTTMMSVPPEELKAASRKRLDELLARLGVDGEVEVVLGPAADSIVRVAEERRADLVVLGTSGRTGLDRLLLGSVAVAVVRHAPCPVLVARPRWLDQDRRSKPSRKGSESGAAPL